MQPLTEVDVVLLSWNRAQMTIETVQNLLEQQDVNVKIWIVDQGSRAEDLQLLQSATQDYANVHIHTLEQNVGVPAGRNIGTRLGKAPYVISIDNDAIFESSQSLKETVDMLKQEPQVGVISFRIKNFFTGQDDELSWVYPKSLKSLRDREFLTARFVGCGHAIRRDVFEKVNGYDDDLFFYWEEVDFSYRVINLGYQLIYTPKISVLHKVAPEARVRWDQNRYYYLVRNALYINFKYNRDLFKVSTMALGYSIKGFYNQVPQQAFKGIWDALGMCWRSRSQFSNSLFRLSANARAYIWDHETSYRGSFWHRVKQEVFTKLPGQA